jgi:glycine/D-amino acid oxidase-like deaminating enzyme
VTATHLDVSDALVDVERKPFWTDRPDAPEPTDPLDRDAEADLVIVGGGLTGLWTAILAKDEDPARDVVVCEAQTIAFGGSGRNGGFISASLTHGIAHGSQVWPAEMPTLVRLGNENFAAIAAFLAAEGIDADLQLVGKSAVATTPHAVAQLEASQRLMERWGERVDLLNAEQMQADVHSPTYLGGLRIHTGSGLMDPARLTWGLRSAALRRGVRIFEHTAVTSLSRSWGQAGVDLQANGRRLRARQVVLATNGYTPILRRIQLRILPIFDHVLVTEPLTERQCADIGWMQRQGLTDIGNQFHYYRRTPDDRILWGGYDAVYYRGNRTDAAFDYHGGSHRLLARQFLETFPQLEGIRFSHAWAGLIDSTSRFTPAFGTALGGTVAYAVGYTGLGTAASRFGAQVSLDLLAGRQTERTRLRMVRKLPVPFPPEPFRYPIVQFTRSRLAKEDRTGKRGLWLRTLDQFGLGFNS